MRILSIRGENLASLYGPFALPLDESPFAETGLFSIAGPTGAGKSTLMDALCLALYGRTPRLGERGRGVMVGREGDDASLAVEASDVRNILSRGAGEGFAEVDFEGVDGRRYRATWRVNRAHGKASGKLQAARMTLEDAVTGEGLASGLNDVSERVKALVGYSFEDFKRAVVLPQFEFTAFLKARSDERAVILERITGTEVYASLSKAAYQRAKAEREKLDALRRDGAAIQLLSPEERAAKEQDVEAHFAAQEGSRALAKKATEAVRWHEEDGRLADAVRGAHDACARAAAGVDALAADRAELAEVARAQPLRAARDAAARTAGEREAAAAALEAARVRLAAAEKDAADRQRAEVAAAADVKAAEERLAAGRPALDDARRLDAAVDEARRRAREASDARAKTDAEAQQARAAVEAATRKLAEAETARAAAERWLADHAATAPLAAEWPRWQAALRDHAGVVRDLARTEELLAGAREAHGAATARRTELEGSTARLEREHARAEKVADAAAQAAAGDDPKALAREATTAAARRKALEALAVLAGKAADARAARDDAQEGARRHAAAQAQAEREEAATAEKLAAKEAKLAGAREALDRIKEALDLEDRREALADGEPCPLCGATEHPYARKAPTDSLLRKQTEAVQGLEAELKELGATSKAAAKEAARQRAGAEKATEEAARQAKALEDAQDRYARAREKADLPGVPARAMDAGEKLGALLDTAEAELEATGRALQEAAARQEKAAATRGALEAARKALEAAEKSLHAAVRAAEAGEKDVQRHGEQRDGLARRRDGAEADLDAPLGFRQGWRAAARSDAEAFARECARVVDDHRAREAAARAAEADAARLKPELAEASARAEEKRTQATAAAERARSEADRLAAVQDERAAVLGGRAVADVERELVGAVKDAASRLEAERKRRAEADQRLAAAREQVDGGTRTLRGAEASAADAARAFAEALADRGLDAARAAALLARDQGWIDGTERAVADAEKAANAAQVLLAERERLRAAHGAQERPEWTLEEARVHLASAEGAAGEATAALAAAEQRLALDDAQRARAAELLARCEAQQAASLRWERLEAVIGSADGKRFRTFAQGLALDALLLHASHHLRWLAPRYALLRVPGEDLELQVVDRDLGDEVRTLNGLSGGETFLVSLALALGLASLSTRMTQSRTLFIDEGFGTLDRDTLENAMSALEALRATGRTIGVISHVPELHERIGVQVTVERVSAGRSRVVLPEASVTPASPAAARAAS